MDSKFTVYDSQGELDLRQIANSGQCFRLREYATDKFVAVSAEIKEKSKADFLVICQRESDDLISRSALLKEVGDPDDGMVWPSKRGIVDLIMKAPAV